MGLFDRKPKMFDFQGEFEYMEYPGKDNLPDDLETLAKMELAYCVRSLDSISKAHRKEGYVTTVEYYETVLKLFSADRRIPLSWEWQRKFSFATHLYNEHRGFVPDIKKFYNQFDPDKRKRLAVKMIEEAIVECVQEQNVSPGYKLDLVLYYLKCFGNYEYIMSLLKATTEKEMAQGKKATSGNKNSLYTQAVIDFLEYDWPYFYENEFGILPEDRPRNVSGILKKYNLTVQEYYTKADSHIEQGRFMIPAERVNPAQVINYHFKDLGDKPFPLDYIGEHFANSYKQCLVGGMKDELFEGNRDYTLYDSLKGHCNKGIAMAGEALVNLPGMKSYDYESKKQLCTGAYALLMRKNGYPEIHYKNQLPKPDRYFSTVLTTEQRARKLEKSTAVSKMVMFEPEL